MIYVYTPDTLKPCQPLAFLFNTQSHVTCHMTAVVTATLKATQHLDVSYYESYNTFTELNVSHRASETDSSDSDLFYPSAAQSCCVV